MSKKILISYFSASGFTKKLAERMAKIINCDLFEIVPEQVYTEDDLNWQNQKSRSSVEMADRNSRPAILTKINNIEEYDTIFVGFPIWWYREPSIIDTFFESYSFDNKTIIPFATSGVSPIGDSAKNIKNICPNAKVFDGERLSTDISDENLKKFLEKFL